MLLRRNYGRGDHGYTWHRIFGTMKLPLANTLLILANILGNEKTFRTKYRQNLFSPRMVNSKHIYTFYNLTDSGAINKTRSFATRLLFQIIP